MMVLGVRIDNVTIPEALEKVRAFFNKEGKSYIFTPNPEIVVRATSDELYRSIINKGDLNLCDGFGIKLVSYLKGERVTRVTGVDFMLELCAWCRDEYKSIYLLGGKEKEVVKKTMQILREKYPGIKIVGADPGPDLTDQNNSGLKYDEQKNQELLEKINDARPDIIFVAFGMGKQEKWLSENLPKIAKVKIGMGVGGSFDYISGNIPRAPLLMRKIGLEWAYRFFKQPERFKRIFNATLKFLYLAMKEK